jgi:hypothetical protein
MRCTSLTPAALLLIHTSLGFPQQSPSSQSPDGLDQAMEKQKSKMRFPTLLQPLRLRTITSYGVLISEDVVIVKVGLYPVCSPD